MFAIHWEDLIAAAIIGLLAALLLVQLALGCSAGELLDAFRTARHNRRREPNLGDRVRRSRRHPTKPTMSKGRRAS